MLEFWLHEDDIPNFSLYFFMNEFISSLWIVFTMWYWCKLCRTQLGVQELAFHIHKVSKLSNCELHHTHEVMVDWHCVRSCNWSSPSEEASKAHCIHQDLGSWHLYNPLCHATCLGCQLKEKSLHTCQNQAYLPWRFGKAQNFCFPWLFLVHCSYFERLSKHQQIELTSRVNGKKF